MKEAERWAQLLHICYSSAPGTLIKGFHCTAMNKGKKPRSSNPCSIHIPGDAAMLQASEIPASSASQRSGLWSFPQLQQVLLAPDYPNSLKYTSNLNASFHWNKTKTTTESIHLPYNKNDIYPQHLVRWSLLWLFPFSHSAPHPAAPPRCICHLESNR